MEEPDFLDARPETARHPDAVAPPELEEEDDDLVFFDAAADSGLDIKVIAPPKPSSGPKKSKAEELAGLTEGEPATLSTSMLTSSEQWALRDRDPQLVTKRLQKIEEAAEPAPVGDPYLGKDLGPFRVEKFISLDRGQRRYLAIDSESQEICVLDVYPLRGSYGQEFKNLAERAERACRVKNPFLSLTLGAGRTKECFFVGREVAVGSTLRELLDQGEVFSEEEVAKVLRKIGQGLKSLHGRDLAHGDVSLDTIRREKDDLYVLHDAGLARVRPEYSFLSGGGEVTGSPGFTAPEAIDSGRGSPAADLYSLGCVAYSLLAGEPPFKGDDPVQVLMDQLNGEVPSLLNLEGKNINEGLAVIVRKLTGYTPFVRYARVSDLDDDLRSQREGKAIRPFPSLGQQEDLFDKEPAKQLDAGTLMLVLLLFLDLVLAASVGLSWHKARQIRLEDPLHGYELPLPGVSEGGYGDTAPTSPVGDAPPPEDPPR